MANKRAAMDALMPGIGRGNLGNSSGIITDSLPNNSAIITDSASSTRQHRNRPLQEKAVRKTYSFYPSTIRGLEEYADDNRMTYSQVINLALRQLIPRSYFE
ncbi:hypothetical protein L9W92_16470 [Pelotomaculum terephthalicicum JT]|uniref:hypothetical protein n=1 Tax=Pelotomaculum terephthalicicum TaxID=206393 RepID=UPI001F04491B|nr:hypothetical protein [Pelotomaculum terephthalicicum]MCG9969599.1 hypothetical protein [Pelotomaculum terephthalicicum JT]